MQNSACASAPKHPTPFQGEIGEASYRKHLGEPIKVWAGRGVRAVENKFMFKIRWAIYNFIRKFRSLNM